MKHCQCVNDIGGDEIDDAIGALNHLANVGPAKLRDHSARLGKPLEAIGGSEQSLHMERCIPGRTSGNVL